MRAADDFDAIGRRVQELRGRGAVRLKECSYLAPAGARGVRADVPPSENGLVCVRFTDEVIARWGSGAATVWVRPEDLEDDA